ncbi:hypothetical protein AA0472_0405 [Acetobacter estunensis NRIC 0472]|uniref:Uncharacterized protein n=1 Tax=Acetobacter estunensis TaxID=104097 RepID=A0A967EE58_9PROT|nr:hypothetical protein [Acetobacter estunensis]NHO54715.1 hypothetical protein [Acetobacter estunensis]GBQ21309.1 hypothetical protein AA0472_0405 [Acetobacter estunensis NRIC 0472]
MSAHVARYWARTSDQVGYFLAGKAFIHGNWRLHGWTLTPPDFWTSDIPLSGLLSVAWAGLGHSPISPLLLAFQPAVTWTALVASLIAVVRLRLVAASARWGATLLVLTLFAVPLLTVETAYFVTLSAIHLGSLIYGVWALHHAARYLETGRYGHLTACGLLAFLGIVGDPLLQVMITLPVLLFCISRFSERYENRGRLARLGSIMLAMAVLAPMAIAINQSTGGFAVEPLNPQFVAWQDIGGTLSTFFHDVLLAFGADPFGHPVKESVPTFLHFILLGLCLWQAGRLLLRTGSCGDGQGKDPFFSILLLATLCNAASLVLSNRISAEAFSIASVRYFFPGWATLCLVMALCCARQKAVLAVAGLTLAFTIKADARLIAHPPPTFLQADDGGALLDTLLHEEPSIGIGTWWHSLTYEIASQGSLTVLPAVTDGNGHVVPFQHIHENFSFDELTHHSFFVLVPSPTETYDEAAVLRTFGAPTARRQIGRFVILRYQRK